MDSSGQFDKSNVNPRVGHDNAVIAPGQGHGEERVHTVAENRTDPSQKPKNAPPGCQAAEGLAVPGR